MRIQYSIVFVSDMNKSIEFYRDILGFPLNFESPHWTEFSNEGCTLALHWTDRAAAPRSGDDIPAGTTRIGIQVQDITEFHERMVGRNVGCVQEPKEEFGVKLAQYRGPDGLIFSVSEAKK